MKIRVKLISTVQYLLIIVQRKGDEKSIRMYTQKRRKGRIFNKNRKGLKKRKVERRTCGEQKKGNGKERKVKNSHTRLNFEITGCNTVERRCKLKDVMWSLPWTPRPSWWALWRSRWRA